MLMAANKGDTTMLESHPTRHQTMRLNGARIFYREAGPINAPTLLLPHGYPCSSFQYRNLLPALADSWHLVAPDYPGFGYSDTPEDFSYDFNGYARFMREFTDKLGIADYFLYLHDYGSQIGLRLAIAAPKRVRGLIIQNGDIYEDQLGPKYDFLKQYWHAPTQDRRVVLENAVTKTGLRNEFIGEIDEDLATLITPDLWELSWAQLNTPRRRNIMVGLMEGLKENLTWFPEYQTYLQQYQPPTLIVWGPQDGYMPEGSAEAYLRDLPEAELHLLRGGHWLLESNLDEVVPLIRDFLTQNS